MAKSVGDRSAQLLIQSLQDALTNSQYLSDVLREQTQTIDALRTENERLQNEIATLHSKYEVHGACESKNLQTSGLFKENVAKQAEIERLKSKLRRARIRANTRGKNSLICSDIPVSSDVIMDGLSSPRSEPVSHMGTTRAGKITGRISSTESPTNNRRHDLTVKFSDSMPPSSRQPLQTLCPNNATAFDGPTRGRVTKFSEHGMDAVQLLGEAKEDGHPVARNDLSIQHFTKIHGQEPYQRLDHLLNAPSMNQIILHQLAIAPTDLADSISHGTDEHKKLSNATTTAYNSTETATNDRPQSVQKEKSRTTACEVTGSPQWRPARQLDLSLCDVTPKADNNCGYVYKQTLPDKSIEHSRVCAKRNCCGNNLKVFTSNIDSHSGTEDHRFLPGFLRTSPKNGSDLLSNAGKGEILHEVCLGRMENNYGRTHQPVHERQQSPVGFWNAEMPDTQEGRGN